MNPPWHGFAGLRVVADVHGEAAQFEAAVEGARAAGLYLIQLGDLTDRGPDSPAVLRLMFRVIDEGRGLFLLGNHDHKLRRALAGGSRRRGEGLDRTLAQLEAAPDGAVLRARALEEIARAPAWLRDGPRFFVHGGFHPGMLVAPAPPDAGARKSEGLVARALYGRVTGGMQADGYPERSHAWLDQIPAGLTVYCGHERRSGDGRPHVERGRAGGCAVFLDCGAGKGGHLAWVDLPAT